MEKSLLIFKLHFLIWNSSASSARISFSEAVSCRQYQHSSHLFCLLPYVLTHIHYSYPPLAGVSTFSMLISPNDSSSCKAPKKWYYSLGTNERLLPSGHGRIWIFSSGRVMHLMLHKMLTRLQNQSERNSSFIQISNNFTSAALCWSLQNIARLFSWNLHL